MNNNRYLYCNFIIMIIIIVIAFIYLCKECRNNYVLIRVVLIHLTLSFKHYKCTDNTTTSFG